MKLYLDSANIEFIKKYNDIFNIDGVTTNPSIVCKEDTNDFDSLLSEIISILHDEQKIFVEVVSHDTDSIVSEAKQIVSIKDNLIPKIPVTVEGLQAIKVLSLQGIDVLATAIMNSSQAYLAAHNGAKYLAPYYNRMSTYDDAYKQINIMQNMLNTYKYDAEIVAAGFHSIKQVEEAMSVGVESVTVNPDILTQMFTHVGTDNAVKKFEENWFTKFNRKTLF